MVVGHFPQPEVVFEVVLEHNVTLHDLRKKGAHKKNQNPSIPVGRCLEIFVLFLFLIHDIFVYKVYSTQHVRVSHIPFSIRICA